MKESLQLALHFIVQCHWVSYLMDAQSHRGQQLRTCAYNYVYRCASSTPRIVFQPREIFIGGTTLPAFPVCKTCQARELERRRALLQNPRDQVWSLVFKKYPDIPFERLKMLFKEKPVVAYNFLNVLFSDYLSGLTIRSHMLSRQEEYDLEQIVKRSAEKRSIADPATEVSVRYDGPDSSFDSAVRLVEST